MSFIMFFEHLKLFLCVGVVIDKENMVGSLGWGLLVGPLHSRRWSTTGKRSYSRSHNSLCSDGGRFLTCSSKELLYILITFFLWAKAYTFTFLAPSFLTSTGNLLSGNHTFFLAVYPTFSFTLFTHVNISQRTVEIIKATSDLDQLKYYGERKPQMWWGKFEQQWTRAFVTYNQTKKQQV